MIHVECESSRSELPLHQTEPKPYVNEMNDTAPLTNPSPYASAKDDTTNDRSETKLVSLELSESEDQHEEQESAQSYPSGCKFLVIMVGLALSCILVALDNTIMATAIPKITDQFGSLDDVGWYGSAYLLTNCSVSLLYGKLYTFFSIKWVYLVALGLFELGSLVCGITPNSIGLILGRAVAGIGAGGIFPGTILIIAESVPMRQRPIFTALISAIYSVSGVAGPIIGGALTDHATWRWCFYINLPLGGVTCLFVLAFYHAQSPMKTRNGLKDVLMQLDPIGLLCFLPSMISLLLALQWGGTRYPWSSTQVIVLFVVFGVLLVAFVAVQWWQQDRATISPQLIMNRNVWGASIFVFCLAASLMEYTYYLPIWFQSVKGASATRSGVLNLPMLLTSGVCSILVGAFVSVSGGYMPFVYFSTVATSVAGGLLTTLRVDSSPAKYLGYQALYGIGVGAGVMQPIMAVQAAVSRPDIPSATVIVMFVQSMGGAISVSAAQNLFHTKLLTNLARNVPEVDAHKVVDAGATMLRTVVPDELLPRALEAYSAAITYSFYLAVAFSALSIFGALPMQWLSVRTTKA